jgi:ABC-type sugar transport system substrate-binding protein
MHKPFTRRDAIKATAVGSLGLLAGCEKALETTTHSESGGVRSRRANLNEEYVWLSANANLPLFIAHDHPALKLAGEELGVKVTIAGPNSIDIPSLVGALEQTVTRKPAGIMVVGWDPSALVPPINKAIESGVPVVCVDADVPTSKRYAFIGTNWFDLGVQQAHAMVKALNGRKGKVAMIGLIEQAIDQQAFEGFRSIIVPAGLTPMEPQQDRGNQAEAARVVSAILQANPDVVGIAGFDSESGPGMGQAIKEAGKTGKIVATTVDAEEQHLRLVQEGVLTAAVGQKRELFTYQGLKALYDFKHSPVKFTSDDKRAGIAPIPVNYNTGTYTVTKQNIELFLKKA